MIKWLTSFFRKKKPPSRMIRDEDLEETFARSQDMAARCMSEGIGSVTTSVSDKGIIKVKPNQPWLIHEEPGVVIVNDYAQQVKDKKENG